MWHKVHFGNFTEFKIKTLALDKLEYLIFDYGRTDYLEMSSILDLFTFAFWLSNKYRLSIGTIYTFSNEYNIF